MTSDLNDKVAIVTGAGRGLGREYAEKLAAAGARVVAGDVLDCAETVATIQAAGGRAVAVTLDVRDQASCNAMAERAMVEFGRIDVLVNNAALYGSLKGGRFDTLPEDDWDDCMDVNVNGIWRCCKAVVGQMKIQKSGSIINISSLAALAGLPYALHYSTSKAAVIGMTRSLARELGRDWIRVNAIGPSAVMTEGTTEFFGDKLDKAAEVIAAGQSLKRNLEPEDLAGTVLYLASDASKFVTGQTIMVDGGTVFL
ncbi:MAG: glucose 1-dehydrogenase [Proteobacteria bacterium]|nr:glucose 1-dehydrogenase [Pseudomonadota bacterium]